jgi:hypothetical protein
VVGKLHTIPQRKQEFPGLSAFNHWIKSPQTILYQCVAWAMGDDTRRWWPDAMGICYWPPKAPRAETIEAFTQMLRLYGYSPSTSRKVEKRIEKVALYALNNSPKHLARQLQKGKWTSKLGDSEDIEHTIEALEGPHYGTVVQIYARPRPAQQ